MLVDLDWDSTGHLLEELESGQIREQFTAEMR